MSDKLTEKQIALVDTIVATGCSIKDASEKAGYSTNGSKEAGRISASRTLRLPVQLEASRDILDRVGLRSPDRVSHSIQGDIKINIDLS